MSENDHGLIHNIENDWEASDLTGEIEPFVVFVLLKDRHLPEVIDAKKKELQHFKNYKFYKTVPDIGHQGFIWAG